MYFNYKEPSELNVSIEATTTVKKNANFATLESGATTTRIRHIRQTDIFNLELRKSVSPKSQPNTFQRHKRYFAEICSTTWLSFGSL